MYLLTGEVKIFDMNWNNVAVMTVGTQVKEMGAAMIEAWIIEVTLTGEKMCCLNQGRDSGFL
jgi:hypothetical protein